MWSRTIIHSVYLIDHNLFPNRIQMISIEINEVLTTELSPIFFPKFKILFVSLYFKKSLFTLSKWNIFLLAEIYEWYKFRRSVSNHWNIIGLECRIFWESQSLLKSFVNFSVGETDRLKSIFIFKLIYFRFFIICHSRVCFSPTSDNILFY